MSQKYWTVTIQVNEVTPPQPIRDGNGYAAAKVNLGRGTTTVAMTERQVVERFATTVRADTELEVYRKAMALLEVNRPPEPHLHRASCDGVNGERLCDYPDGPSIASPR